LHPQWTALCEIAVNNAVKSVVIVGVGLIGGSFAMAIRKAGFAGKITGVSSAPALAEALGRNIIDASATLEEALPDADLIYLAQPIGRILHSLAQVDRYAKPGALITDAGSTKQAIVTEARRSVKRARFLGGHPMAGKEARGAAAADADLFRNKPYVLTPSNPSEIDDAFLELLHSIGARAVIMGAAEHDRLVAASSHLPQLASTALASTLHAEYPDSAQVAGPGLLDSTRLALSSYDLWRDIVSTNTVAIEEALSAYIQKLEHIRENLRTRQLQQEFTDGAAFARMLRD
jgi:prephenate dehydrogenase